jgi:hypothetical protein
MKGPVMQSAPSLRRIGSLAVLAAFSGIFLTPSCKSDDSESEAQSGATNWLRCSEDLDCSRVPGASCAADDYCVDEQGERIEGDDLEDDDGEDDDGEDDDGSPVADDATALEPSPDEEPSASEGEALGPVPEPQPGTWG